MDNDRYTAAIDRVERTAANLHGALDVVVAALEAARRERIAGLNLTDIVRGLATRGGKETRLMPTKAFREFERAISAYRATAIRVLVDEEGMTYSEVAKLTGVSRQMVARLYRAAESDETGAFGDSKYT
jgi:DNA-directed RNA polymerase specialized sigma24 family protein